MEASPPKTRTRLLIAAPVAALLLCGLAYGGVSSVALSQALKAHRQPDQGSPSDLGLAFEDLTLTTSDGVALHAMLVKGGDERAIVLVHGLDSSGWRGDRPVVTRAYVDAGFTVLTFDLRGQGRSADAPLGLGWKERRDVQAAVKLLRERGFQPGHIGVHGTSYGAATTLLSAPTVPDVGAFIADSPFADVRDLMEVELESRTGMGAAFVPGVTLAGNLLYDLDLARMPPLLAAKEIAPRPLLLIHGSDDQRIPVSHSERIFAAANQGNVELWILDGLGHTEGATRMKDAYLARITSFFQSHL